MSNVSSINFKKSNTIQTRHNDRDLAPNYLIGGVCECNRNHKEALKLKNEMIKSAIEKYQESTNQKFQAKSYEWSAVVNLKADSTMQDLEKLTEHFQKKYGFQCYQIAIHRDEGHINEQGEKVINHHAHLEFITLDKITGKNNFRREHITPKVLRELQSEVAEILQMERGVDKRLSGAKRIEPRAYARIKETERSERKAREKESAQKNLTQKEVKKFVDSCIENLKGKGYEAKLFHNIRALKKGKFADLEALTEAFDRVVCLYTDNDRILDNAIKDKNKQIQSLQGEKEQLQNEVKMLEKFRDENTQLKEQFNTHKAESKQTINDQAEEITRQAKEIKEIKNTLSNSQNNSDSQESYTELQVKYDSLLKEWNKQDDEIKDLQREIKDLKGLIEKISEKFKFGFKSIVEWGYRHIIPSLTPKTQEIINNTSATEQTQNRASQVSNILGSNQKSNDNEAKNKISEFFKIKSQENQKEKTHQKSQNIHRR